MQVTKTVQVGAKMVRAFGANQKEYGCAAGNDSRNAASTVKIQARPLKVADGHMAVLDKMGVAAPETETSSEPAAKNQQKYTASFIAEYIRSHPAGKNPLACRIKRDLEHYASEIAKPLLERNSQLLLNLKLSIAYHAGNKRNPAAPMKALWGLAQQIEEQGGRLALETAGEWCRHSTHRQPLLEAEESSG